MRRVDTSGTISTVAGTGAGGYSGDGGPAVSAQLQVPQAVAFDKSGNLYIADSANFIRKVTPDGTISTLAGTGADGYRAMAAKPPKPPSAIPMAWQWMQPAMSIFQTNSTVQCEESQRAESSPP